MQPDKPKPPLRFRKLRIAWSVFWGLACVLLIVLWVRSYWWGTVLRISDSEGIASCSGSIQTVYVVDVPPSQEAKWILEIDPEPPLNLVFVKSFLGIAYESQPTPNPPVIVIPHWLPTLLIATLSAAPWFPWSKRFTLRTLLIATTLVAVVLGLVVYGSRSGQ
jgi:hypothetical protein